jgi:signal peptidase
MKIFKIIYYVFLAGVISIALLLVVSIFPITGNFKVLVVQSGSMEPVIHTGSVVIVKPASDYKIGDIITFGPNTKTKAPTTHRIADIKVQNGIPIYITKGDANNAPDTKEIRQSEIIGKVLFSVPYVGYAVAAAKQPLGFTAIIILPAAIIIYDEIRKIWEEAKKMRKKKEEKNVKVD